MLYFGRGIMMTAGRCDACCQALAAAVHGTHHRGMRGLRRTSIIAISSADMAWRLNLAGSSARLASASIFTFGPRGLATCGAAGFANAAGALAAGVDAPPAAGAADFLASKHQ